MKILIGTKNKDKIEGAKKAFEKYFDTVEIEEIKVESEVGDQPMNEEILQGAKNRVKNLKEYAKSNNIRADFYIATEGGITNSFGEWININTAAIESDEGIKSVGISQGPQIPERYIEEIKASEMKSLKNRIFNKNEYLNKDLDSILTHGKFSRIDLVRDAFIMALVGQINGDIWR